MDTRNRYKVIGLFALALLSVLVAAGGPGARLEAVAGRKVDRDQETPTVSLTPERPCIPPPGGMLAWYPLDGSFDDRAEEANAGQWRGAGESDVPVFQLGKVGTALALDGVDKHHYVEVADHPELDFGERDFTLDAWVYPGPGSTGLRTIVDKRTFSPTHGYALFTADGRVGFQMADASVPNDACSTDRELASCTNFDSGVVITEGAWHFVAVSVRRAGGAFFFIDGQAVPFDVSMRAHDLGNTAPLGIGGRAEGDAFWHGMLDEVELIGRALDESEVRAIYAAGSAGKCKEPGMTPSSTPTPTSTPPMQKVIGANEVVNLTVMNACGFDADGFRFELWGVQGIISNYSVPDLFQVQCDAANPPPHCNPFVPPPIQPNFNHSANTITLEWQNPPTKLPRQAWAHFGYTLQDNSTLNTNPMHKIKAEFLSTTSSPQQCVTVNWSSAWSYYSGKVTITVSNYLDSTVYLRLSGVASEDPVALGDLLPSNGNLMRSLGTPVASAVLKAGDELPITIQIKEGDWGVVLLADWYAYDTQPRELLAQAFHARSVDTVVVQPTVSPTSMVTPTPSLPPVLTETSTMTPSSTSTESPSPTDTPSSTSTPSPSPSPTETPVSPTPTSTQSPAETPTSSRTPLPRTWIYLPSVGNWLSPGVISRSGAY